MSEMLLINPRRRRKMTAKQRKYFGKKRRRNPRRRRRARATRRRRRNPVAATLNPRRKRRRTRRASYRRRRNPTSALRSRRIGSALKPRNIQGTLMNALPGAFGALGLDIALGYIPVPANWKLGILGYVTKSVGAIGLGMIAQNFVRPATAAKMTEGALTVMFHGILRNLTAQFAPAVPLGMYLPSTNGNMGYYGSGWNPEYESGLEAYLPDMSMDPMSTDNRDLGMYLETDEYY